MYNLSFFPSHRDPSNSYYTYNDNHKGKLRLNVSAHGGAINNPGPRFIMNSPSGPLDAIKLKHLLDKKENIADVKLIRLIVCYSGNGFYHSLAAQLSRLFPDKEVKGYVGTVSAGSAPEIIYKYSLKWDVEKIETCMRQSGNLIYKNEGDPFHSVTYKNGRCIKNHRIL
ncbi:hypothetical protein WKW50_24845 [Ochrobactrum sp. GPK 3]|uniref:hypothetical protein n=1 Tax=Brucella sp. 22210 TaxID=3453892 RepID=UPI00313855F0